MFLLDFIDDAPLLFLERDGGGPRTCVPRKCAIGAALRRPHHVDCTESLYSQIKKESRLHSLLSASLTWPSCHNSGCLVGCSSRGDNSAHFAKTDRRSLCLAFLLPVFVRVCAVFASRPVDPSRNVTPPPYNLHERQGSAYECRYFASVNNAVPIHDARRFVSIATAMVDSNVRHWWREVMRGVSARVT